MEDFIRVIVLALASMAAISALKKRAGEFSLVLSLVCIGALGLYAAMRLKPVLDLLRRLEELTGINNTILEPAVKTALIGVLTNVSAGICADCGEGSVAKMVELCGSVMALYLSAPLITAVLELLDELLGG